MKLLRKYNEKYFRKFSTDPVEIKSFDPKIFLVADKYQNKLALILNNFKIKPEIIGSTKLKIAGKGEIEFGIFPSDLNWNEVIKVLKRTLGKPGRESKDYVRFNDKMDEIEIEIIVMRGHIAKVNKSLMEYLESHPEAIKEYLEVKEKYKFSKREYVRQKYKFFAVIIKKLPD